jgi:predicted nucleic acid-binding protein
VTVVQIYLDSNIVIYLIEQPANFGPRAAARIAAAVAAGDTMVVSDLTRLECRVLVIGR